MENDILEVFGAGVVLGVCLSGLGLMLWAGVVELERRAAVRRQARLVRARELADASLCQSGPVEWS